MRRRVPSETLLRQNNCEIPDADKSISRFTTEFNKTTQYYKINTCIRKIHFLAQTYWESDRLRTTREYDDGDSYSSETHKSKHDLYKLYLDFIDKYAGETGKLEQKKNKIILEYESCKSDYDQYEQKKDDPTFLNLDTYKSKHDKYAPYLADKNLYDAYKSHEYSYKRYNECIDNLHTENGDGLRYKGKGLMQLTWRSAYKSFYEHLINKRKSDLESRTKANITLEELLNRSKSYHELVADDLFLALNSAGFFWSIFKKNSNGTTLNDLADYGDHYAEKISEWVNGGENGKSERFVYYKELKNNVYKLKNRCINYASIKTI